MKQRDYKLLGFKDRNGLVRLNGMLNSQVRRLSDDAHSNLNGQKTESVSNLKLEIDHFRLVWITLNWDGSSMNGRWTWKSNQAGQVPESRPQPHAPEGGSQGSQRGDSSPTCNSATTWTSTWTSLSWRFCDAIITHLWRIYDAFMSFPCRLDIRTSQLPTTRTF